MQAEAIVNMFDILFEKRASWVMPNQVLGIIIDKKKKLPLYRLTPKWFSWNNC